MNRTVFSSFALGVAVAGLTLAVGAHAQDTSKTAAHTDSVKHSRKHSSREHSSAQKTGSASGGSLNSYTAQPVQEYHAKEILAYHATPIQGGAQPQSSSSKSEATTHSASGMDSLLRTFGLAVPGVAYTVDNYAANTRTVVTSSGTVTKSAVRINPDHTYDWNSAWDDRLIHGRWVEAKDGILLLNGQEHKDWLLRSMEKPSGKATVTLWDKNATWYNGTPLH